jgi:uncharacterized protein YdhG (YjbR/CyaY superfamily)
MATAKKSTTQATSTSVNSDTDSGEWSAEEREAMKEAAKDKRRAKKGKTTPEEDLAEVLGKIAAMNDADREVAERVHELVMKAAPELQPRTWYGMPAYAKDSKVVCFFQDAGKFKARYNTLGFQDAAQLDDGSMWATSFALVKVTPAVAKQITALVKKATS